MPSRRMWREKAAPIMFELIIVAVVWLLAGVLIAIVSRVTNAMISPQNTEDLGLIILLWPLLVCIAIGSVIVKAIGRAFGWILKIG